jgi:hypothetical protein
MIAAAPDRARWTIHQAIRLALGTETSPEFFVIVGKESWDLRCVALRNPRVASGKADGQGKGHDQKATPGERKTGTNHRPEAGATRSVGGRQRGIVAFGVVRQSPSLENIPCTSTYPVVSCRRSRCTRCHRNQIFLKAPWTC